MRMMTSEVWFPRSRRQLTEGAILTLVLFILMFALHAPPTAQVIFRYGIPVGFRVNIGVFAPLVFLPAAILGYLNRGVIVSLLASAGVTFGAFLPSAIYDTPDFPVQLIPVIRTALLITVVVGGVGFIVGVGVRQLLT